MLRLHFPFFKILAACSIIISTAYCAGNEIEKIDTKLLGNWDISKATVKTDGKRTHICLNGFWKFLPLEENTQQPPKFDDNWINIIVPSLWKGGITSNYLRNNNAEAITKFNGKNIDSYNQGWYYREFATPKNALNRKALLRFDGFFSSGNIYLNGKKIAERGGFDVPYFACDITSALKPVGETNTLYVSTAPDKTSGNRRASLQDNVWLTTMPKQNIGTPVVSTFVKAKKMTIDFANPDNVSTSNFINIRVKDAANSEVVFSKSQKFSNKIELDFITPKLWSIEEPNLYFLEIDLLDNSGKIADSAKVRFGFRELVAEDAKFKLNGNPISINAESSYPSTYSPLWVSSEIVSRKDIRAMKSFGINAIYGNDMTQSSFYDIADEEGFLILENFALSYNLMQKLDKKSALSLWRKIAEQSVKYPRLVNHPSVSAILVDIWYNGTPSANNPALIGIPRNAKSYLEVQENGSFKSVEGSDPNLRGERYERSQKVNAIADAVADYYPNGLVLSGSGTHIKDAYGAHIYHTWGAPNSELSALFSRYAKDKKIPIFSGEMAVPYHGSFCDLAKWPTSEMPQYGYWLENCARILGNDAYLDKDIKLGFAFNGYQNNLLGSKVSYDHLNKSRNLFLHEGYSKVVAEMFDKLVYYWRYDGLSGLSPFEYYAARFIMTPIDNPKNSKLPDNLMTPGVKVENYGGLSAGVAFNPFADEIIMRPNLVSIPFIKAMSPLTCRIVSASEDVYNLDHAYFSNKRISKAISVLNMTKQKRSYAANIKLIDEAGATVQSNIENLEVEAFSKNETKFKLKLPSVEVRREYLLKVVLVPTDKTDSKTLSSSMKIQVFPEVSTQKQKIMLFGADAEFTKDLKKLGYSIQEVSSLNSISESGVLIVAANALSKLNSIPDFTEMATRGINTLIMEQPKKASVELMNVRSRKSFINAAAHPILEGFKDADFSDWRGSFSLLPAYGKVEIGEQWVDWGNRNMVSGTVFRRPQNGNYIPLLVCGFDLYQTPLMEYRGRNGSWIASQLEITQRLGLDPVATTVFTRTVNYLANRKPIDTKTKFIGGENGKKFLDFFGVKYDTCNIDALSLADTATLIISDPDWKKLRKKAFELTDFVFNGGKILYVHTGKYWDSCWLPFALDMSKCAETVKANTHCAADAVWCNGWNQSELYWRDKISVNTFTNYPETSSFTNPAVALKVNHGTGSYVFVSITPESFKNEIAVGKTSKLLSALFTSCGAFMEDAKSPYEADKSVNIIFKNLPWEFSLDPSNKGLAQNRQSGENGSDVWLAGQQTNAGEYVRIGISYDAFLKNKYKGVSWYRTKFKLTAEQATQSNYNLALGNMHSANAAYINGKKVGESSTARNCTYRVGNGILKEGENLLVVRLDDKTDGGGLLDTWFRLGNKTKQQHWKLPYPESANRDYWYSPDAIRQY